MQMEFRTEGAPAAGQSKGKSPMNAMGQVIGANSWVLTGDDDPQDWNVAVAHRALCKERVDCGVHRAGIGSTTWKANGISMNRGDCTCLPTHWLLSSSSFLTTRGGIS